MRTSRYYLVRAGVRIVFYGALLGGIVGLATWWPYVVVGP